MSDPVAAIEVYVVNLSQDRPYLGTLREGEEVDPQGYFVRQQNGTVYPRSNRSLVIRILTEHGVEGWGETYGIVAPGATAEIIKGLLAGFVIGSDPFDVRAHSRSALRSHAGTRLQRRLLPRCAGGNRYRPVGHRG